MITPIEKYSKLAKVIDLEEIYFKREDLHHYGSHKGRSIPYMIDHYHKNGDRRFVISSSGNAALAAALHTKKINDNTDHKIELDIFVGHHINKNKLNKIKSLEDTNIRVLIKERPLQALSQAVEEGSRSLRQSTDDTALIGYHSLAEEILAIKDNIGAVIIGTSSGTTAQALAEYFLMKKSTIQVHIVQTSSCHPLIDSFETFDGKNVSSIADAIVDQTAHRKDKLIPLIKKTNGYGWVASNEDILSAQELVRQNTDISISTNSALSIVGAMHLAYRGWKTKGAIVCMICGE